jgi:hypothetical protein
VTTSEIGYQDNFITGIYNFLIFGTDFLHDATDLMPQYPGIV